ncbi:hypothetical protein GCM10022280_19670 [Sphingomonas swuensis]|uniref:Cytochrome C n=1 Tax=Sphingomonas swuensis TaxID=977800 RepID=A0ABP7T207_9SPHN
MRVIVLLVAASTLAAGAALAAAPLSRSDVARVQAQRHHGYEQLGRANRMAKQAIDKKDLAATRTAANQIGALAAQAPTWFPIGSGPEGGKTYAKAAIWQNRADFDARMRNFGVAARAFQAAAAGGDLAAIRTAHGRLGQTCSACHESYRGKHD